MTNRMRQLRIKKEVTNRDSLSLDKYLTEIGKVKLITADQEIELAQRIKQGDTLALEELCKANLRFVVSVAKQYQGQGLTLPDLISEGNLGLIKAAGRFDETRGFKFISYAVWWIRQQILQSIAEQARIVRLPLNKIGSINRINKAFAKLEQEYERAPNAVELAELLEMTVEEVKNTMQSSGKHLSVDAPIREGSDGTLLDILPGNDINNIEDAVTMSSLRHDIERALDALTAREADVLRLYFGLKGNKPHTLEEIGQKFDLTRERVRQIKEKAIRHLKLSHRNRPLKQYLE